MKNGLIHFSMNHPKIVILVIVLITLLAALQIPKIIIDTDPENMLPADEEVRGFHEEVKEVFGLNDMLVLGIVREEGVFNPETLARVVRLTDRIREMDGVLADDLLAPGDVDDIYTTDEGILRVETLMEEAPETMEGSERVLAQICGNPILRGKLASDDGKVIALFIPLESKDVAHSAASGIEAFLEEENGDEEFHLAGIPVAQDTFGAEMFKQMAVSAPAAFFVIFLLLLFFFRNVAVVIAPMVVAMVSVIWTMGLLIGLGYTVHIMSSMIPIFLIPIAVLNSIHILSEFHERYQKHKDMRPTIMETMDELFVPMIFTSLTTVVGFASLIMTPIPPVQVFGAFVAIGIATAWFLSVTFNIAYAMLLPKRAIRKFGVHDEGDAPMQGMMHAIRRFVLRYNKPVVAIGIVVFLLSIVGVTRIVVNDNPVKWFKPGHPLRVADEVMNEHLAGTYLAYLSAEAGEEGGLKDPEAMKYIEALQAHLDGHPNVGSTSSIADVVKKMRGELKGDKADEIIPDSAEEIAQYLFLYEMSGGNPDDLFKFITPEADRANIWVQMRNGENRDVSSVIDAASLYMTENPPPGLDIKWAGLSYINVIWQNKMVSGMMKALLGSFVTVLIMMMFLFRSVRLGLLSVIPLTATITLVYGVIGFTGKAYDMPVAILSSLTLGLSIDFAIHFLQRSREIYRSTGDFSETMKGIFGAPSRAIARNILVIAIGFVPMFFASLVPYITVSAFFFSIMVISGITTFFTFPAILSLMNPAFLGTRSGKKDEDKSETIMKRSKEMLKKATGITAAIIAAAAIGLMADTSFAENPDPVEIMKTAHLNLYYSGDDGSATVRMELKDKKGKTRIREFIMLRIDLEEGGAQKYYTYFLEPGDVRRTTFMVWKEAEKDDSRWIYIPAIDLVRRISASDKGSSFVGSDFSYEDVSGRHWNDDNHTFLREEEKDGHTFYVIESVPKEKDSFSKKLTWVSVDHMLPEREEYYNKKDKLERIFQAEEITEEGGFTTITKRSMTNVKKNHSTTILFRDIKYNIGLEDGLFTERYLKAPPSKYISS